MSIRGRCRTNGVKRATEGIYKGDIASWPNSLLFRLVSLQMGIHVLFICYPTCSYSGFVGDQ